MPTRAGRPLALFALIVVCIATQACGSISACSQSAIRAYGQRTARDAMRGLATDIRRRYAPRIALDAEAVRASECRIQQSRRVRASTDRSMRAEPFLVDPDQL